MWGWGEEGFQLFCHCLNFLTTETYYFHFIKAEKYDIKSCPRELLPQQPRNSSISNGSFPGRTWLPSQVDLG